MIKFVAFDIDGVIYSSENFLLNAYIEGINNFIKESKKVEFKKSLTLEDILTHVGKTYVEILSAIFPGIDLQTITQIRKFILISLEKYIKSKSGILLPYVKETLKWLKSNKFLTGTASNGSPIYVKAILETYKLNEFFDEIKCVETEGFIDKTDIIDFYLKKYNLKPSELVLIGDRKTDFEAALKTKVFFIGIKGHGNNEELKNAKITIHSLKELPDIILSI